MFVLALTRRRRIVKRKMRGYLYISPAEIFPDLFFNPAASDQEWFFVNLDMDIVSLNDIASAETSKWSISLESTGIDIAIETSINLNDCGS